MQIPYIVNLLNVYLKVLGIFPSIDGTQNYGVSFLWWIYLTNHVLILLPTIYSMHIHMKDIISISYALMELVGIFEVIIILLNFKHKRNQFKILLNTIGDQLLMRSLTKDIDNIATYLISFSCIIILYSYVMIMYMNTRKFSGEISDRMLVTMALYPFSLDSTLVKSAVFINQLLFLLHVTSIFIMDGIAVLLMCTCAVKMKNLNRNLKTLITNANYKFYIREHQCILALIKNTNQFVGIIIVKTMIAFVCYCIITGIQVIYQGSDNGMVLQYVILIILLLRIFMCVESAENLATMNSDIRFIIYSLPWYNENRKFVRDTLIVVCRCQNLPKIHVSGLMDELNRNYLKNILYVTYSYFTMIQAMIRKN